MADELCPPGTQPEPDDQASTAEQARRRWQLTHLRAIYARTPLPEGTPPELVTVYEAVISVPLSAYDYCHHVIRQRPTAAAGGLAALQEAVRAGREQLSVADRLPSLRKGKTRRFWEVTYPDVFAAAVGTGEHVLGVIWDCVGRPGPNDHSQFDGAAIIAAPGNFVLKMHLFGLQLLDMPEPSDLLAQVRWRVVRGLEDPALACRSQRGFCGQEGAATADRLSQNLAGTGQAEGTGQGQGGAGQGEGNKGRRRRGRRQDTDPKDDERVANAWGTGQYRTYAECGQALRMPAEQVKTALDRHRKRHLGKRRKRPRAPE